MNTNEIDPLTNTLLADLQYAMTMPLAPDLPDDSDIDDADDEIERECDREGIIECVTDDLYVNADDLTPLTIDAAVRYTAYTIAKMRF